MDLEDWKPIQEHFQRPQESRQPREVASRNPPRENRLAMARSIVRWHTRRADSARAVDAAIALDQAIVALIMILGIPVLPLPEPDQRGDVLDRLSFRVTDESATAYGTVLIRYSTWVSAVCGEAIDRSRRVLPGPVEPPVLLTDQEDEP